MSFFIARPETVQASIANPTGFFFMSDLHIGAAVTDYALLEAEVKEAVENNDRININGDIFDAIMPKDIKRFTPETLHPHLQGRSDVLNPAIEMAVELLRPAVKNIDVIGIGNHESAVEKYHGIDLLSLLVTALNSIGGNVSYGGYTGFIDYRIKSGKRDGNARFVVYYHHGSGGAAPVSKGMIDFARKGVWVDSDVVWLGHKHNRIVDSTPLRIVCPKAGVDPTLKKQVFIMTGGYMDTYKGQTSAQALKRGRRGSYASDWGLAPQDKGGMRILVKTHRDSGMDLKVVS